MSGICATLVIAGRRTFSSLLSSLKEGTKAELQRRVASGIITQEKYEELISL